MFHDEIEPKSGTHPKSNYIFPLYHPGGPTQSRVQTVTINIIYYYLSRWTSIVELNKIFFLSFTIKDYFFKKV